MQAGARLAALIEIMDQMLTDWQAAGSRDAPFALPAEHHLRQYTHQRRYIGSKDRRFLHHNCYEMLRAMGRLRHLSTLHGQAITGRNLVLAFAWLQQPDPAEINNLFSGATYHPEALSAAERHWLESIHPAIDYPDAARANLPEWLYEQLHAHYADATGAICAALQNPAPVDIRVNLLRNTAERLTTDLQAAGILLQPIPGLTHGFSTPAGQKLTATTSYEHGAFEIQDRGSQAILDLLPLSTGMTIIDYCAGAGGKSLALASMLGNNARIIAYDSDQTRLRQLALRAERAGATCIKIIETSQELQKYASCADIILLDAPCSGIGTLRRHPDLAWRLTKDSLLFCNRGQEDVLNQSRFLLKPGGWLYYVTCSLLTQENEDIIHSFLNANPDFQIVPRHKLWDKEAIEVPGRLEPHRHESDGFFGALMQCR